MNMRKFAGLSLSALMLGGTMVGCAGGGIASASSKNAALAAKQAADNAGKAQKALTGGDATKAVSFAEAAVAAQPNDVGYRALLGASYLKAGRFTSAHAAYADVLALTPNDGKAALNMALAQIAEGQWDAARQTLDAHADAIPARDRGLAIALAGDPMGGVNLLLPIARGDNADAKTRQNLALAMALSGQWKQARAIVGIDLAPADADARIMQWISFAKPSGSADQVASLLGVRPAVDPGRPVALALNAAVPVAAEPVVETAAVVDLPVETVARVVPPVVVPTLDVAPGDTSDVRFAARAEVTQALPAGKAPVIAAKGPFKTKVVAAKPAAKPVPIAAPRAPAKGDWYVQLGAYDSPGVAKDAWARAQRRYAAFAGQSPTGMAFKSAAGQFYRLSVGGFARGDATAMCKGYRAKGGTCFVRAGAGDQVASWVKPTRVQFASR